MENLFISMWNQLENFAKFNDFKSYGALELSIIELIKQLISRKIIELSISDDYNLIIYGVETHFGTKTLNL